MSELRFSGIPTKQYERPAKGNYPPVFVVTFVDRDGGEVFDVQSPVAIATGDLMQAADFVLSGFRVRLISYQDKKTGDPRSFLQMTCKSISGKKS